MNCILCNQEFKNKGALVNHIISCEIMYKHTEEICSLYKSGLSIRDINKLIGLNKTLIRKCLGETVRNNSDSLINAHNKKASSFKRSEKTKSILREKRLIWMKNNPEKTAWRTSTISYPEKLFLNKILNIKWDKKYNIIREYSVFPFYIDFAFVNEKVALEIDGSQHLLPERKLKDDKKDTLLNSMGWSVIRVTENEIKFNIESFIMKLTEILNSKEKIENETFGIFSTTKKNKKKKTILTKKKIKINEPKIGKSEKEIERAFKQRKVKDRPSIETLLKDVNELGYSGTGRKYGVSDNTIRKWLK